MPRCSCWLCRGYRAERAQRSAARWFRVGLALRWGWLRRVAVRHYDRAQRDLMTYKRLRSP